MPCRRVPPPGRLCGDLELLLGVLVHNALVRGTSLIGVVEVVLVGKVVLDLSWSSDVLGDIDHIGWSRHCGGVKMC